MLFMCLLDLMISCAVLTFQTHDENTEQHIQNIRTQMKSSFSTKWSVFFYLNASHGAILQAGHRALQKSSNTHKEHGD